MKKFLIPVLIFSLFLFMLCKKTEKPEEIKDTSSAKIEETDDSTITQSPDDSLLLKFYKSADESPKGSPERVFDKFFNHFKRFEFDEVKKLVTERSIDAVDKIVADIDKRGKKPIPDLQSYEFINKKVIPKLGIVYFKIMTKAKENEEIRHYVLVHLDNRWQVDWPLSKRATSESWTQAFLRTLEMERENINKIMGKTKIEAKREDK